MKKLIILYLLALFFSYHSVAQGKYNYVTINKNDTQEDIIRKAANVVPSERQFRWQRMEMIAFTHFGMNTFTNKEWGSGHESPKLFDPKKMNADQWVRVLKHAGFKELILTCKHHDGFCLWPTKTTDHSVKSSNWKGGKGDVVKAVAEACHKYHMAFGIYLSPWDRNSKYYGTPAYNDFFVQQLTELLTNYGKISDVWFDGACGGPGCKKHAYDYMRWYKVVRKLQPQAVISITGPDVRWVGNESGVGRKTEWSVIPMKTPDQDVIVNDSQHSVIYKPFGDMVQQDLGSRRMIESAKALVWYPAEADVSIRPGWFYHASQNSKVKTPRQLMHIYFTSVGRNGVLLLNVPPDAEGLISKYDIRSLRGFKKLRDRTFRKNLAKGAHLKCTNGKNVNAILDNDYDTWFTTRGTDTTTTIDISLPVKRTFNVLLLQENIKVGQRVEKFELDRKGQDGIWIPVATGTTIGYKRLLQFKTVRAQELRLKILSSRLNPTLSEFGLYDYK